MPTCADCGFLALKRSMTPELDEAPKSYRISGKRLGTHKQSPVCFVRAYDLEWEVGWVVRDLMRIETLKVIQKDRSDCPEWTPWIQGDSPKEHRRMLLEGDERKREAWRWWWGAIAIGLALVVATVAGPLLAVVLDNCVLGGG